MPLVHCEINIILKWTENYVLTIKATGDADTDANAEVVAIYNPRNVTLKITDTNLYVPVVTSSNEKDKNTLGTLKNMI